MTDGENEAPESNFAELEAAAAKDEAPEETKAEPPADDEAKEPDAAEEGDDTQVNDKADDDDGDKDEAEPEKRRSKPFRQRLGEVTEKWRTTEQERDYWKGVAEGRIKPGEGNRDQAAAPATEKPDPTKFEYG